MDRITGVLDQLEFVEVFLRAKLRAVQGTGVEEQYRRAILRIRDARDTLRAAQLESQVEQHSMTA